MNDAAVRMYLDQGYEILPNALAADELALLRRVCEILLAEPVDDDKGGTAHDIGRGEDRRFLRHRHEGFPELARFLMSERMKRLVSRYIGPTPHLFNEQFVVKGPLTGAGFAWHQDSGYVGFDHRPYVTVWIALDDTTAANGALRLLPRDLTTNSGITDHRWDAAGKEFVGYTGGDEGVAAEVGAGTVVVFSSVTLHCSGSNTTDRHRRAYLAQYTAEPLIDPTTDRPRLFAKLLQDRSVRRFQG